MNSNETSKMLTSKEVQEALGLSHMTIYNWRNSGKLTTHQVKGQRNVYFAPKQIVALAKEVGVKLTLTDVASILKQRKAVRPGPKPAAKKFYFRSPRSSTQGVEHG